MFEKNFWGFLYIIVGNLFALFPQIVPLKDMTKGDVRIVGIVILMSGIILLYLPSKEN